MPYFICMPFHILAHFTFHTLTPDITLTCYITSPWPFPASPKICSHCISTHVLASLPSQLPSAAHPSPLLIFCHILWKLLLWNFDTHYNITWTCIYFELQLDFVCVFLRLFQLGVTIVFTHQTLIEPRRLKLPPRSIVAISPKIRTVTLAPITWGLATNIFIWIRAAHNPTWNFHDAIIWSNYGCYYATKISRRTS